MGSSTAFNVLVGCSAIVACILLPVSTWLIVKHNRKDGVDGASKHTAQMQTAGGKLVQYKKNLVEPLDTVPVEHVSIEAQLQEKDKELLAHSENYLLTGSTGSELLAQVYSDISQRIRNLEADMSRKTLVGEPSEISVIRDKLAKFRLIVQIADLNRRLYDLAHQLELDSRPAENTPSLPEHAGNMLTESRRCMIQQFNEIKVRLRTKYVTAARMFNIPAGKIRTDYEALGSDLV